MPSLITTGHGMYSEFARSFFKLSPQRGKICTLARIGQFIFWSDTQTESGGWPRRGQLYLPPAPVEIPLIPGSLCSTEFAAMLIASLISTERRRV